MDKHEIVEYLKKHKQEFKQKYNIEQIALFGSFAKDKNHSNSDVDIAINTKLSDYFLLFDFKESLEKVFNKKVDIVRMREKMNLALKEQIQKEGIYV